MLSEIPPSAEFAAQHDEPPVGPPARAHLRMRWLLMGLVGLLLMAVAWWGQRELQTSRWQARYIHAHAAKLAYQLQPGPSDRIRFPAHGPFDVRLGYVGLPQFSERLQQQRFALTEQTRFNDALLAFLRT